MVIKSENKVSKADVKALINCNSAKVKFMLILLTVTFVGFLIFCMIAGNTGNNFGYCLAGIIWCAVVYVYIFILNINFTYSAYKKKYSADAVVKCEFTARSMAVSIESSNGKWDKRKNYRDMFRIYETADYFFFYVKSRESYIVKKSGFKQGNPKELSEIILRENPSKFIRKVK